MVNSQRVHEVTLPKLFKWYKDDFGFSKQAGSPLMHTLHFALIKSVMFEPGNIGILRVIYAAWNA